MMSAIRSISKDARTELKYIFLLFVFAVIVFWKPLFTSQYSMLAGSDNAAQSYPWLNFLARSIHEGSFPFWNNFDECGRTFIGEIQTGAFHPLNFLMALFPLNRSEQLPRTLMEGFLVLHCFLAAFFMYRLVRHFQLHRFSSMIAGLAFAFSGSVAMRSTAQSNLFMASIWIPAVFLFFFKALEADGRLRQAVFSNLAGLFLSLCLLGGHHQPFLYTAMAVGATALLMLAPSSKLAMRLVPRQVSRSRTVLVTLLLFFFSICYASLQLIPALEYAQHAFRSLGPMILPAEVKAPYTMVGDVNNMGPGGFIAAVFPYLYDVENRPYMGLLPLFFLGISFLQFRKSRIIAWAWTLGIFFLLLALGKWSPLHGLAYVLMPGFAAAREASRILLICHLAFAFLAGFGAQAFFAPIGKGERKTRWRILQILFFCWLAVILLVFGGYFFRLQVQFQPAPFDLIFFACGLLTAVLLLAACRYFGWLPYSGLKIMAYLILLFDFHFMMSTLIQPKTEFDRRQNFEPRKLYAPDSIVKFLQENSGPFRVDFIENSYPRNSGEIFQLETVHGFSATRQISYQSFLDSGYEPHSVHADMLNVRFVVDSREWPLPVIFQQGNLKVYENTNYMPRAWLVNRIQIKASLPEVFGELSRNPPNPGREAYLFGSKSLPEPWRKLTEEPFQDDSLIQSARVEYQRLGPNTFTVSFRAPSESLLVVSENYYPGWKAYSGGKLKQIYQTNGTLMGVLVPAGFSKIVFRYRPTGFREAVALTVLALGFLPVALVLMIRNSRRTSVSSNS